MGRRDRRENPIIHRTKLFGGTRTAMELHRELAWNNAKCNGCGSGETTLRASIYVALSDMSADTRMRIEYEIAMGRIKEVALASGPGILMSRQIACKGCQSNLERAAAKGPSYAVVDLDYGPRDDKPIVGVV